MKIELKYEPGDLVLVAKGVATVDQAIINKNGVYYTVLLPGVSDSFLTKECDIIKRLKVVDYNDQ